MGGSYVGYQEYKVFAFNLAYLCPHLNLSKAVDDHIVHEKNVEEEEELHTDGLRADIAHLSVAELVAEEMAENHLTDDEKLSVLLNKRTVADDSTEGVVVASSATTVAVDTNTATEEGEEGSPSKQKAKKKEFYLDFDLISLQTSGY